MDMREQFEAWYLQQQSYGLAHKAELWKTWQASRAALCIELPAHWYDERNSCHVMSLMEVTDALDKAGVPYA